MLRAWTSNRRAVWHHAMEDLRGRYAGSSLGWLWNLLTPLALIGIYSLVFTNIMQIPSAPGERQQSYLIYLCAGLFPWLAFADTVVRCSTVYVERAFYLKKFRIPEETYTAGIALAAGVSLVGSFLLLLVIGLFLGYYPCPAWATLPLPLLFTVLLALGVGQLCAVLNVFFRDLGQALPVVLQLLMWSVPIIYKAEILPVAYRKMLYFHPFMPALEWIRSAYMFGRMPHWSAPAALLAWSVVLLTLAGVVLRRLRADMKDQL